MEKEISIRNLSKSFVGNEGEIKVLDNINLDIKKGEFISIIGHSGCGKSTLLKILAGLHDYSQGHVLVDGKELRDNKNENGLMIFQDHRLLPWEDVETNIGLAIYDRKDKKQVVQKYIDLVHLNGFEKSFPSQLSGGMAQRAAIARALAKGSEMLLLDEPFGALDALTKIELQNEILNIWKEQKTTMVLVTHDIDEAIYLSDRVVIVSDRPATIKNVIDINLGPSRSRTDGNFIQHKIKIMKEFFGNNVQELEYYI